MLFNVIKITPVINDTKVQGAYWKNDVMKLAKELPPCTK